MRNQTKIDRLETDRLTMRMFRETDLDAYAEMCGDADVMKYLGGATMSRSEAWRSMATVLGHWQLRLFGLWAVEERASPGPCGRRSGAKGMRPSQRRRRSRWPFPGWNNPM